MVGTVTWADEISAHMTRSDQVLVSLHQDRFFSGLSAQKNVQFLLNAVSATKVHSLVEQEKSTCQAKSQGVDPAGLHRVEFRSVYQW